MKKNLRINGFTLLEMIVYTALISVIFLFVINTLLSFSTSYNQLVVLRILDQAGGTGLERMSRDISSATKIDTSNSTFGSNSDILTLVQTNGTNSTTTKFYLQNGTLKVDVNGAYDGPLSPSNATVETLTLTKLSSSVSSGVRIYMLVQATSSSFVSQKDFQTTVILRGSY